MRKADWKLCADLAITFNSGANVRQCIFNDDLDERWKVSGQINVKWCLSSA